MNAALTCAQATVGIPVRIDPVRPSYQVQGGGFLTVVDGVTFVQQGPQAAAPPARHGVFVVDAGAVAIPDLSLAAASVGSVEVVPVSHPRTLAAAIARACAMPGAPHVILAVPAVARPAAGAIEAFEPELSGTDNLSLAALPEASLQLAHDDSPLRDLPIPQPAGELAADGACDLGPGWYRLRVEHPGALANLRQRLQRGVARMFLGMET